MEAKSKNLDEKLVHDLMQALESFGFADGPPDWFPLAPCSRQALQNHNRQEAPRRYPHFVNYAQIFWNQGILYQYRGKQTGSARLSLELDIDRPSVGWALWFMDQGRFPSPNHRDKLGWAPIHHAANQSVCLKCSAYAFLELLPMTNPDILTDPLNREGAPCRGWSVQHILSSSCDSHDLRVQCMQALLNTGFVGIDLRTVGHPHNTASLLAAGSGYGTMLRLLLDHRADPNIKNSNGAGLQQLGRYCSGRVKRICGVAKAPSTMAKGKNPKHNARRISTGKFLRHAQLFHHDGKSDRKQYRHRNRHRPRSRDKQHRSRSRAKQHRHRSRSRDKQHRHRSRSRPKQQQHRHRSRSRPKQQQHRCTVINHIKRQRR